MVNAISLFVTIQSKVQEIQRLFRAFNVAIVVGVVTQSQSVAKNVVGRAT